MRPSIARHQRATASATHQHAIATQNIAMHGLGSHTLMRDNDEGTKHGSCTLCTTTARLSPCEKPSDPLTNAGVPGGRPDSAPADAPAGREGARRRTSRAFALDQRPVTNSITASPARPRARKSMPRLANSKASSVLTFRPVHSGDEGELWASAKLDEDMHDGRAGRGEGGEADGLAESRRSGAVGGRSSSVRAGQGRAERAGRHDDGCGGLVS